MSISIFWKFTEMVLDCKYQKSKSKDILGKNMKSKIW